MTTGKPGWPENGFSDWIGRRESGTEILTPSLIARFRAVVPGLAPGDAVPPCLHWCLAPIADPAEGLGHDGHPRLGTHLPPIPLPRRMWAGGTIEFVDAMRPGDEVTRVTTIRSIERKSGRTGELAFVTLDHEVRTGRGVAIREAQDIVYREPAGEAGSGAAEPAAEWPRARFATDPVLLFRYSAITFNGHRIHYDHPYATGVEGYRGLVVHGPLIATLLANLARKELAAVSSFRFRGRAPLICGETLELFCRAEGTGLALEARSGDGRLVMTAEAR
jgi:3-methylfumaryl-CoA hydratase